MAVVKQDEHGPANTLQYFTFTKQAVAVQLGPSVWAFSCSLALWLLPSRTFVVCMAACLQRSPLPRALQVLKPALIPEPSAKV